ncbi:MAG: DUF268 domain-containing protein [Desulfobacterales bacterium]|nr:DUF268 domain-containing protein [Desulfobacterales bacterium]
MATFKKIKVVVGILKPNGYLFLQIPCGLDYICWNSHRIYGPIRLPLLIKGWEVVDVLGPVSLMEDFTKKQFEPIFILKNIHEF